MKDITHLVIVLALLMAWVYTREPVLIGMVGGQLGGVGIERSKFGSH